MEDEINEIFSHISPDVIDDVHLVDETTHVSPINAPILGMIFENFDDAYGYYNSYGRVKGFSVRKQRLDRDKRNGEITRKDFCCNREGSYCKKATPKKKRDSPRCGCKAMLEVKLMESGKIVVSKFLEEHNHDLVPSSSSHLLRSQRTIDSSQKELMTTMHASGFTQSQIYSYFSTQASGPQNLNFIQADCNNLIQKTRKNLLKQGDVVSLNEYFKSKKVENKSFFHAYRTNMDNEITGIFFADAKSRRDYAVFGDALCFDTTFNTNKYNLLCAPLIGVNNHGQTILFGCGMIDGESEAACVWLFDMFLEAMSGKTPITIFTDQAAGINCAIRKVFPNSDHRLCLWHIYQNAATNLSHVFNSNEKFSKDFKSCIYDPETIEEFEYKWNVLLERYDLKENGWLKGIYELRKKWAQVYARSHFCAGMTTTQRSESINKMLKTYFARKLSLREFVAQYDKAVLNRREKERIAEIATKQTSPNLISIWKVEVEASNKFSRKIFNIFQSELGKLVDLKSKLEGSDETTFTYSVLHLVYKQTRLVTYISSTQLIRCTCRMFEFQGILCSHCLKVLREELNVKSLPPHYYLKRWSCDVSDEIVLDSYGEVIVCENNPLYLVRYSELSHLSQRIVAKSSRDDQLYELVKSGLIDLEAKVKNLTIDVQENSETHDATNLEVGLNDPKVIKSKGGKSRKKSALELKAPKKRVISMSQDVNQHVSMVGLSSGTHAPIQGYMGLPYDLPMGYGNYSQSSQGGFQVMPQMNYPIFMHPQATMEINSDELVYNSNFPHDPSPMHFQGDIPQIFQGPARQLNFYDQSTDKD